jgi:hypothetical protein
MMSINGAPVAAVRARAWSSTSVQQPHVPGEVPIDRRWGKMPAVVSREEQSVSTDLCVRS